MSVINYIVATAGHVDHGKSALVIALTGVDPDRLPEEKTRGITIELGFAHLDLPSPPRVHPPEIYRVGVVDVPGHEDFVKNMVAGVGSIDGALMVIATDDGCMMQTEEHLHILTYLGVKRGIIALTKIDLDPQREAEVSRSIRERTRGSFLEAAPIIATSTRTGQGIEDLKKALAELFADTPRPVDVGKPRLPLDRAFAMRGVGTIGTGTLSGGELHRGQIVVAQPAGIASRIRSIQSHNVEVETAGPGSRVALQLTDVEPRTDRAAHDARVVGRGDVITLAALGDPSSVIDVMLSRSPNAQVRTMKTGTRLHVHHGTRAVAARLHLLDVTELSPGDQAVARLRLAEPIFAFLGDRFILRDSSERHTLAGGYILQLRPHGRADRPSLEKLFELRDAPNAFINIELERESVIARSALLQQSMFSRESIDQALDREIGDGHLVEQNHLLIRRSLWEALQASATAAIDAAHAAHPDLAGLELSALRAALLRKHPSAQRAIELLLSDLGQLGFVRRGAGYARRGHVPSLPPALQNAGQAIRSTLALKPFDPPSRNQLAPDVLAEQALRFLIGRGEAIELSRDIVISSDALQAAIDRVREHIRVHGPATVSELKSLLNSSRRIMVPLLERFDCDGITRRDGDRRSLK